MVGKDGAEVRRGRIERIAQAVQKALYQNKGEPIALRKTVVHLSIKEGNTKERILDYLKDLAEDGEFELDLENDRIKKVTI